LPDSTPSPSPILGKIIDNTMDFRICEEDEVTRVDIAQHAGTAYDFGNIHAARATAFAVTNANQESRGPERRTGHPGTLTPTSPAPGRAGHM
jgi:hypothetical protein